MKNFITMKMLKVVGILFLAFLMYCVPMRVSAQGQDSKGTDFWLMFNTNLGTSSLTLFIASDVNTSGTVDIPGLAFSAPFVVAANTVTSVIVPDGAAAHTSDVVDNKGIHVTALNEVTVYGLNRVPYTTDAYLGLPKDVLGTDYIIMSYSGALSELGIVGTVNGTTVTITPSVTASGHTAGIPYNVVLDMGQTYQLGGASDLTGTFITSTQPVGVMGANQCANIPPGFPYCDHICEMLPPTTTWGKKFGTVPLRSRSAGDTWRCLASTNGTVISINGVPQPPINRGQILESVLTTQSVIESTEPILVAQFANGSGFSGNPGDPFMMLIPPLEQFLAKYTVTTVSGFVAHFINVVAPNAIVGTMTLDGVAVAAGEFTPIGASGFSGAQLAVTDGVHNLQSTLPFGVFMYGFNTDDSYGYPGGQSFSPIATVASLVLTPETGTAPVGTNRCWDALVKDQFGVPVEGVRVDFTITGPNASSTGFANTNASGIAHFCYIGTNPGLDNIVASVGTISDASTFTWTDVGTCDCITCNGTVVEVNSNITINLNGSNPATYYSGDPALMPYFTADKTGPTADTWEAIFDLGANKLLLKNGATIKVTNVPNTSVNQKAPGIVIKSTCDVEIEDGAHIVVNSMNQKSGNILLEVNGQVIINGEIRNELSGTLNYPGAVTVTSKCGNISVGRTGLVEVLGTGGGGNTVNLTTCASTCNTGDITIEGLVKSFAHNTVNLVERRPNIRVASFNGKVIVNANTVEPLYDEFLESGGRYDIYGGLLSWSRDNVPPGKVEVQAKDSIKVNGHGIDPTGAVRKSFGAIAAVSTMSEAPGGLVDVRSLEASIWANNRAFDVSGRNRLTTNSALVRLWAKNNISLERTGANNNYNPVVNASSPSVGDKGGVNQLRAFSGEILIGTNALVSATVPLGLASVQGANYLVSCVGVTNNGTVSPADLVPGDDAGSCSPSSPDPLFTDCMNLNNNFVSRIVAKPIVASQEVQATGFAPVVYPNPFTLLVYPNPFTSGTTVSYDLAKKGHVSLDVFDVYGRKVAKLANGEQEMGSHRMQWNAENQPVGVYYIHLKVDNEVKISKVNLIR